MNCFARLGEIKDCSSCTILPNFIILYILYMHHFKVFCFTLRIPFSKCTFDQCAKDCLSFKIHWFWSLELHNIILLV